MSKDTEHPCDWHTGISHANGIGIHYRRTGGEKPPLVALHGLLGSGACLLPLARSLEGCFDVLLPDARGHGGSDAPDNGYLYHDLAADLIGLIGELNLAVPALVGHSMGGMTAAVAASKLGSRVSALILIDPTFIGPERQREVYESDVAEEHQRLLRSTREDLLAQARLRSPNRSAELIEHLVDARLRTNIRAFDVLTPPNPDWRELIQGIRSPILLLIGDHGVVSRETARELGEINPLLHYELIPDAGHGMPYDEPARTGAAILSFLEKLPATGTGAQSGE